MFRLDTERLTIRTWAPGDRAAFHSIMSDPAVTHFVHGGLPYTDEETNGFLDRQARQLAENGFCMGPVIEKTTNLLVGIAGTQPLGTTGELEIGWIFARDVWGRGYATEAGAAAMRYVLDVLQRDRVLAIIDPDNAASKRVAARLGMTYERRVTGVELGHRLPEIEVDLFTRTRES
ncbi:MAG TPA: GNAT family N-acetyltransferase [Thermoanaerobaculia bacterium]|nr:GNAT family N-acetyltransferase [Thermoanaerobaculia bacterium]